MEQKQLDEIEQSFTGEEFIDEDIIIEQARPKAKPAAAKAKKEVKEVREAKEAKKMPEKKAEEKKVVEVKALRGEARKAEVPKAAVGGELKMEVPNQNPKAEPKLEVWPESKEEKGLFREISTWKAITGIVLILLLLSVFTQGFNFAKGGDALTGAAISSDEAESRALAFVNGNLLQPPFEAQVKSTQEVGPLYKITFSIAGEDVDSYMTRDGALFFPQGFDPKRSLLEQLTKAGATAPAAPSTGEYVEEVVINGSSGEVTSRLVPAEGTEDVEVPAADSDSASELQTEYTITAKKWLFSPNKITVPRGSTITLQIVPEDMPPFTFVLQAFAVRKQIDGPGTITFTADRAGTFPFLCGSCEEFRGMTGTIVVE